MIKDLSFGALFYGLRMKSKITLRAFCIQNGFDSGNISKLERNMQSPPGSKEKLMKLIGSLNPTELDIELMACAAQNYHIGRLTKQWESKMKSSKLSEPGVGG